jgi:hypothetical protein
MTNPRTSASSTLAPRTARALAAALAALSLAACGDFGGAAQGTQSGPGSVFDPSAIPGGQAAFEATVYPLVTQYCSSCHAGAGPGSPHFANPSAATAYTEILRQSKVNLGSPDQSRIVRKIIDEQHLCWTTDCDADGLALQQAVATWADMVDFGEGGVSVGESLSSSTLMLSDGTEDSSSERYNDNIIAMWDFKEGAGGVAFDQSGLSPAIDLALQGEITWLSAWGIQIESGIARAMGNGSRKLHERIADPETGSGQYSVEAWITNATTTLEGPARIITYSANAGSRNFGLGQVLYNYDFRNRSVSPNIGSNGTPALLTYDADQDLQDRLQHVVITYDLFRGRRIYVDGRWTDDVDEEMPGRLWNWSGGHVFALGNEPSLDRQWEGQVRFVAIYDHALTEAQIQQNFDAGVGKRLSMSFDVSRWAGPGSAIEFTVSEFDNASYMFCQPTFRTPTPAGFRLAHVRIAVNGVLAPTGQGFVTLDTPITETRQELTRRCAVIPKGTGPLTDQFTIVFEHLGGFQNLIDEPDPPPVVVMLDPSARPNHGLRDYARIRESMADVTGVDPLLPAIEATFSELEQQLPSAYDVRTFVSSHQVGISKLALEFCDALVESNGLRTTFFGDFPFSSDTTVFADVNRRNQVADALYDKMLGTGLAGQPTRAETRGDLSTLVDALLTGCAPCDQVRTRTIVKGECAAVLASAAVSMH